MSLCTCCLPGPGSGSVTVGLLASQVSQLARATVVTSRLARRESRRGQGKALRRMVLAELQSQEESYVAAMQALVNDYLEPMKQADPGLISNEMMLQLSFGVREILEIHNHFLAHLDIAIDKWEEEEAVGELVTKTFSEANVFNTYSGYVNNLAALQKNFKQEAEANQAFARFLKVSILMPG